MADTIYRQWLMLKTIPRYPRKVDAAAIERQLADQGIEIHRRTIQRDLISLSTIFPIVCDDDHKPYGWSWAKDAEVLDLPNMDPNTALTFRLVQDFISPMMPPITLRALKHHMEKAAAVLSSLPANGMRDWPRKMRVIPAGQPLIPAEINPEVLNTVYEALLLEKRFTLTYLKRGAKTPGEYDVNPLGLVFRGGLIYLVCTIWEYKNPIQLILHRMIGAKLSDRPQETPPGFSLDAYIRSGEFGFLYSEKPLRLQARFNKEAAIHLAETPVSEDQKLKEDGEEHIILKATVQDTLFLRNWLLGFGELVEVQKPASLHKEFSDRVKQMAALY